MVWIRILAEGSLLTVIGYQDYRHQDLSVVWLTVFSIAGVLWSLYINAALAAVLISIWVLCTGILAKKASHGGVGNGDLWILASMPYWEQGISLWAVYGLALLLAGVYSVWMLIKASERDGFAFVPCVWISFVAVTIYGSI